ncbi:lipopolysaccharide biosynthesis protein [Roseivirga thermotolerans]|uniref:lipopolysaccharide biosynthesis protein n=1 Tax=Roseivirga thermotolerans TaxID=1758176 RepID=UPI0016772190|nr:hypothetical protein [Roseivirga thermotolerans]
MLKKFQSSTHLKNFKNFIGGGVLFLALNYVVNFIINTKLTKDQLGLFSYYQNIFALISSVLILGMHHGYLRFNENLNSLPHLSKHLGKYLLGVTLALYLAIGVVLNDFYTSSLIFLVLFNERTYFYRSVKNIRTMNLYKVGYALILLASLLLFFQVGDNDYKKVLGLIGFSYALVYIVNGTFSRSSHLGFKDRTITLKDWLKYSVPIALTEILSWTLQYSDQVFIKLFFTEVDLSNYSIAGRVLRLIKAFTSLFLLYYPLLYFEEARKSNFATIRKFRASFITILLIMTLSLIGFKDYIYILLGARKYLEYTGVFTILIVGEFLRISSSIYLTYRTYLKQTFYMTIIAFSTAVCSVGLNSLLLKQGDIYTAAYVQLTCSILYLLLTFLFVFKQERAYFTTKKNE